MPPTPLKATAGKTSSESFAGYHAIKVNITVDKKNKIIPKSRIKRQPYLSIINPSNIVDLKIRKIFSTFFHSYPDKIEVPIV